VAEASVFERGWPTVPAEWRAVESGAYSPATDAAVRELLGLRPMVNRLLESCRRSRAAEGQATSASASQGAGAPTAAEPIGSSLEVQVLLELSAGEESQPLADALTCLEASAHPEVDNLADWLLVSALHLKASAGIQEPTRALAEAEAGGLRVRLARAEGQKCERCWHYETDIGQHASHPTLCGRCVGVLEGVEA
jgi:isoleucyl-tRNA synthetase